ncbi:MAG: SRPBCC family protein [Deltaproteobacteria bacterium]|nr:SRPBCC family protein [Deltaproteobacteria bacterium]
MKTFSLKRSLWLPQPREKIFNFFSNPHNLDRVTPPWLRFKVLSPPSTTIQTGTLLDYRLRLRGIPIFWQSEISLWQPPLRFVDRQTRGPYSLWVHDHTFDHDHGGTLVGDNVEYAVPGGTLVNLLLVAPDLERIFDYRHQVLKDLFDSQNSRGIRS